jgi:hypothetical protein
MAIMLLPETQQEIEMAAGQSLESSVGFTAVLVGFFSALFLRRRIKRIWRKYKQERRRIKRQMKKESTNSKKSNPCQSDKFKQWIVIILVISLTIFFFACIGNCLPWQEKKQVLQNEQPCGCFDSINIPCSS